MRNAALQAPSIAYEQPLNERIRTLLRVEFLHHQGQFGIAGESQWHSRLALSTLVELTDLLSRSDLRCELQKELQRLSNTLLALQQTPGVDPNRLHAILCECECLTEQLHATPYGASNEIKGNDFLNTVAQRSGIAGGTCSFDLPVYHRWLHQSPELRRADLEHWFEGLAAVGKATHLVLRLLRESADAVPEIAYGGTFQASLDRTPPYQMLRVLLAQGEPYFPEISGNRHFCTIRFLEQTSLRERPQQVSMDVEFRLERCVV
ncbi:MAG: cell division protein ZapD [Nitrococcus mobilis]|nr:cell division protein ZapD [Nitrococcus mobilis]